ncbi:MAG: cation:proton antiporter [Candidatus Diapherotrites archaeon]|nr:cation:proton antiporter [Candidatus Diapherotrites archaeon]
MDLILVIILCLVISATIAQIVKRARLSEAIGLILAGLIIGTFKDVIIGSAENLEFIWHLGDLGLIGLMFLAGLEISWALLTKEEKESALIGLFGALIPFALGGVVFYALGFDLTTALIIGVCLSVTAEGTKARVLIKLGKLNTRIGSLVVGASIVDNIIGILLFSIITVLIGGAYALDGLLILILAIIAFFSGIIVHTVIGRYHFHVQNFENAVLYGLAPFFFIAMMAKLSNNGFAIDPLIILLMLIVAVTGKMFSISFTKPFIKFNIRQLWFIGWAMNSRGAIEIVLAFLAFESNLIDATILSSLIITALVTTMMFPVIATYYAKNYPKVFK